MFVYWKTQHSKDVYSQKTFCVYVDEIILKFIQKVKGTRLDKTTLEKKNNVGFSLVVQWLRIRLPMQGTQVRALVQEDPTCCGATKPVRHNY